MSAIVESYTSSISCYARFFPTNVFGLSIVNMDAAASSHSFAKLVLSTCPVLRGIRAGEHCFHLGNSVLPQYGSEGVRTELSSRPVIAVPSDARDFQRYGSSIHTLFSLPSILAGSPPATRPSLARENEVRHYNWSGRAGVCSAPPATSGQTLSSYALWGSGTVVGGVYSLNFSNIYGLRPETGQVSSDSSSRADIISLLSSLRTHGIVVRGQTGSSVNTALVSDYENTPNAVTYRMEVSAYFAADDTTISYSYDFLLNKEKVIDSTTPHNLHGSGWTGWFTSYVPSVTFHSISCSVPRELVPPTPASIFGGGMITTTEGWSADTFGGTHAFEHGLSRGKIFAKSRSFRDELDKDYKHLLGASTFSACDAIQSLGQGVSNNILQTVVKLPQISSAAPQIREAVQALSHIAKRDLSLATLKEILDLASSTTLQASFQWRPMLELLTTHLPTIHTLSKGMGDRAKLRVCRGSWKYTFRDGELSRPATLTTRTKIVLDESPRGLLATILGVDAFGLFPKPSNIWDLLPFTFVVNWVTGVGNAIRRAEYASILLTMPAYYVHTYTVESPFLESELLDWNLATSHSSKLSMKIVFRDISSFTPLPRNSRFAFDLPTSAPPLGVVLALLYQLVLGR
jgi:hypothetical protein